jgi:hypothetical protein
MRFKPLSLLLLIVLAFVHTTTAHAQKDLETIRIRAQSALNALISHQFDTFASYCYPKVVTLIGGRDSLIQLLERGFVDMEQNKHATFMPTTIAAPKEILSFDDQRLALLPYTLVMKVQGGTIKGNTYLIAVQDRRSDLWTFIDGGYAGSAGLKQVLPNAYGKLKLPIPADPTFVPDDK